MIPVIAFFNTQGGVGTTTLVYHLAWKLADMGFRVLAADLDPQANLTGAFLDEDELEEIWHPLATPQTIFGSLRPLIKGTGDIADAPARRVNLHLDLVPGDIALSSFEDELSAQWPNFLAYIAACRFSIGSTGHPDGPRTESGRNQPGGADRG